MIQMNLFTEQKETHRLQKQTYGYQRVKVAAKSLQSCPTLCNPRDGSPPGSPVPGILQARTLEWVAISFSKGKGWGRINEFGINIYTKLYRE